MADEVLCKLIAGKIGPPMREILMPDVLPSLLGLEIDVHEKSI